MFGPRIEIDRTLYDLAAAKAAERGYATVREFVEHVLEKALADASPGTSDAAEDAVRARLRGLGYLE